MLHRDDDLSIKITATEAEDIINFLHKVAQDVYYGATFDTEEVRKEKFERSRRFHIAAAELERAYRRAGLLH